MKDRGRRPSPGSSVAEALGGLVDVEEDAPDLLVVGAAPAVEVDAAPPALEQLGPEMALQHADAVGDGGRGDAELLAGMGEAAEPGGGLEESQAVEGRQGNHGFGRRERWVGIQINTFFVLAQIYFFNQPPGTVRMQCRVALEQVNRGDMPAEEKHNH